MGSLCCASHDAGVDTGDRPIVGATGHDAVGFSGLHLHVTQGSTKK